MRKIIIEVPNNCSECEYFISNNDDLSDCIIFDKKIKHCEPCQDCKNAEVKNDND
jgi:hypothetical protein